MTDTIEVFPALTIDANTVNEMNDLTEELHGIARSLLSTLPRADAARDRAQEVLRAHPVGRLDDMWMQVPGLRALLDAVCLLAQILAEQEKLNSDWSRFEVAK